MSLISHRILLGVVLSLAISSGISVAEDRANPRVMLVLDGSASMWARVDGDISKIEIAKKTIADLVGGWESKVAFGVTTYGHRKKASCQDIETVLPVAAVDASRVVDAVNRISPKGKSPLAAALHQAAEQLDYKNQSAKILLVSDGIENCGQDPCHMAALLAARAKDLSIDVIGFDMNNHQMGKLECIASNANGHIVRADISDFSDAMDDTMTAAIEDEEPNAQLTLSTTLSSQDVHYVVYMSEDDDRLTKIAESFAVAPTLNLPEGTFVVEAILGDAQSDLHHSAEIRLAKGAKVEHVFDVQGSELAAQ